VVLCDTFSSLKIEIIIGIYKLRRQFACGNTHEPFDHTRTCQAVSLQFAPLAKSFCLSLIWDITFMIP
jgi:hypothetical protein